MVFYQINKLNLHTYPTSDGVQRCFQYDYVVVNLDSTWSDWRRSGKLEKKNKPNFWMYSEDISRDSP